MYPKFRIGRVNSVTKQQTQKMREGFASNMGFIFAAAGSAIGLGNIWRFPWLVGAYGGAVFLVIYLAIVILVCYYVHGEVTLGRYAQKSNIGAFRKLTNRGLGLVAWGLLLVL